MGQSRILDRRIYFSCAAGRCRKKAPAARESLRQQALECRQQPLVFISAVEVEKERERERVLRERERPKEGLRGRRPKEGERQTDTQREGKRERGRDQETQR